MSILVLDVGTTSMRGILYSLQGKKLAMHRCKNQVLFENNGVVRENPEDWNKNTKQIISAITACKGVDPRKIRAVVITAQRSSIIPLDRQGVPLMDTIMWQDTSNCEICERLSEYNDLVFAKTGSHVNAVFSGGKMAWVHENYPEIYAKTDKFVNIPEYINYILTGTYCSDYTYASRTGLFNIHTKTWDQELLSLYGLTASKLCALKEPGKISGYVQPAFAKETGLLAGTPVIHAGGDQQCAAVGQNVIHSGNVSVVTGTGGFIIGALDQIPDGLKDNVVCNCSSVAGKYVIEANVLACSAAFDWFAKTIYGMDKIDYGLTEKELQKESAVTECLVLPYFEGKGAPDWNSDAKALFSDITLGTRRSELFKSMMESIFMELNNHLNDFARYMDINQIFISGGMTSSSFLNQLQADIYGHPVKIQEDAEATAFGAFLVALIGLGIYESFDKAVEELRMNQEVTVYEPDMQMHEQFIVKQQKMNELYERVFGKK